MQHAGRSWLVVAIVITAAALGCGGDDGKKSGGSTAAAGASGESGASGSSGAGGDVAGASGASGGGGSGPVGPQRVMCGDDTTCYPPTNPLTGLLGSLGNLGNLGNLIPMAYACCLDEGAGTCGVSSSATGACEARAMPDSRCPGVSLGGLGAAAGGGMMMAGCSIDDMCGQDGTMFGRGCVENTQAASMLSAIPLIGMLAQIPGKLACDRPMDHMDHNDRDGGMETEDAGR